MVFFMNLVFGVIRVCSKIEINICCTRSSHYFYHYDLSVKIYVVDRMFRSELALLKSLVIDNEKPLV